MNITAPTITRTEGSPVAPSVLANQMSGLGFLLLNLPEPERVARCREANRMGASTLSSLGGPVATDLSRLYEIYNGWLRSIGTGHKHDVWPELARWGIDHVPFAGLFYLKGAANYLLWFHLCEAMHRGWWERTNRRMVHEQGRHMIAYSPGAGVPWGVPGIYTATRSRSARQDLLRHHREARDHLRATRR